MPVGWALIRRNTVGSRMASRQSTIAKAAASALAPDAWLGIRHVAQPGCLRRFLGGNGQHRSPRGCELLCHIRVFTYEDEAVGHFYCLTKESSTIYARTRSKAYSVPGHLTSRQGECTYLSI